MTGGAGAEGMNAWAPSEPVRPFPYTRMSNQLTFAIALVMLVVLLFVVERFVALRRSSRPLLGRLLLNIGLSVLAFAVALVVVRPAALAVLEWAEGKPFGLVHMVSMPVAAQFALSFLLMDHLAGEAIVVGRVGMWWGTISAARRISRAARRGLRNSPVNHPHRILRHLARGLPVPVDAGRLMTVLGPVWTGRAESQRAGGT